MSASDLRDRLTGVMTTPPTAPLEILSHELVFGSREVDLNFGDFRLQSEIKDYLKAKPGIRVVILDNLSCLLPTVAEDKRDDWAQNVLPFLIWLRRRGVALVMLHHANKSGDQRGTGAREDSLDTVIRLEKLSGNTAEKGANFALRFTKKRGVYGNEVEDFEVELAEDGSGNLSMSWMPLEEGTEERVLRLARDGMSQPREVAEELGVNRSTVYRARTSLIAKGELQKRAGLHPV